MYKGLIIQDTNAEKAIAGIDSGKDKKEAGIIVSEQMPIASASNYKEVRIYTGKTDITYTKGYIYENQKDATYTASVTFGAASISGTTVYCSADDFGAFVKEASAGQTDPLNIVSGTMTYVAAADLWIFVGKDSEGETVDSYQVYQGDYELAGFVFTGTPEDGDIISFTCSISEKSADYAWIKINPVV